MPLIETPEEYENAVHYEATHRRLAEDWAAAIREYEDDALENLRRSWKNQSG
jgi:hypothetical protein